MGEQHNEPFQLSFNRPLRVDFQGSQVTSGGLIPVRELEKRLGMSALIAQHLTETRRGRNSPFPQRIDHWSLTSVQQRLVKTGGRVVKHARYYWRWLAEGYLTRRLCGAMAQRIAALAVPAG